MKVYDCFSFYNEFDLLEIRLQELWNTVDYFVISEASTTHRGNPKPFNLESQWDRFKQYASKIRYVRVQDMPDRSVNDLNKHNLEFHQRGAIDRGLFDKKPEDLIIVSDCDEIPRAAAVEYVKNDPGNYERYCLAHPIFYFKLNFVMTVPLTRQINIKATRGRAYVNANYERDSFNYIPGTVEIEHGGWHFCYFGDTNFAKTKIQSFAHSETDTPDVIENINVEEMIKGGYGLGWDKGVERFNPVKVDGYYPRAVLENLEKYQQHIVSDANRSIFEFYPVN